MIATQSVTMDCTVVAAQGQVSSSLESEVVILDVNGGVYHGLNQTGARVWSLVQEPTAVRSICDTLMSEYDVDRTRCEKDLVTLLDQLARKGLVEINPATDR